MFIEPEIPKLSDIGMPSCPTCPRFRAKPAVRKICSFWESSSNTLYPEDCAERPENAAAKVHSLASWR